MLEKASSECLEMGPSDAPAFALAPSREAQFEVSECYLTSLSPQQVKQKPQPAPERGEQLQRQQAQQPDETERGAR